MHLASATVMCALPYLAVLGDITIAASLPFVLVMLGLVVSLTEDLRNDPLMLRTERAHELVEQAVIEGVSEHGNDFVLVISGDHDDELSPQAWFPERGSPQAPKKDPVQPV